MSEGHLISNKTQQQQLTYFMKRERFTYSSAIMILSSTVNCAFSAYCRNLALLILHWPGLSAAFSPSCKSTPTVRLCTPP